MAYGKAQTGFQSFQSECHELAVHFVRDIKVYFQIPESQFSLYKIHENNEFKIVRPAVISALTLRPDSIWHFGIGLTVCSAPETLPQELILIQILIRKDVEGNFFLKYGENDKEQKIEKLEKSEDAEKTEKWDFIPFFDYLHNRIIEVYENQLTQFISQDSRRKIGF